MIRLLLIRHAHAPHVGRTLVGRTEGIELDARGLREVEALTRSLDDVPLAAVVSSPLVRALDTARPLAEANEVEPTVSDAFHEVDFGAWTGASFDALEGRPEWEHWNRLRSVCRAPGGESMGDVLVRSLDGVRRLARDHDERTVAVVSHADVIRLLLTHFLGMPMDHLLRLEVGTASVSTVEIASWGVRVMDVNRPPG